MGGCTEFLAPPSSTRIPPLTELPRVIGAALLMKQDEDNTAIHASHAPTDYLETTFSFV
jgi:hypothetical protein